MLRVVLPLSFIIASRFFGLFIVLPVLSLYALNLDGANEFLVGLLVGVYAITQMVFQMPFGLLSDKVGRKKAMTIGLFIFIIGSLICAASNDIYTMLFGRLVQGSGAVGAVGSAMISDFIKEEERSKAMAIVGGMIGISFCLAMLISPVLSSKFGLESLFYLSAFLSLVCVILLYTTVPKEHKTTHYSQKVAFSNLVFQKDIFLINITNLAQKMLTSIAFLAIPIVLVKELGFVQENLWQVYAMSTVFGFIAMGLSGFLGDGKGFSKHILIAGIFIFMLAYSIFIFSSQIWMFIFGVVVFFIGFNMHEPILQSLITKFVKSKQKGIALGVFNSFGYFGSFLGGVIGGYVLHKFSTFELFLACFIITIIWFVLIFYLKDPREFKNLYFNKDVDLKTLDNIDGIFDRFSINGENIVKFDSKIINENEIKSRLN